MAKAKYTNEQVALFQKFIRSGYDIEEVKNPRFNPNQLKELYLSKKEGIDISLYNSPDISEEIMKQLRILAVKTTNLEEIARTVTESGKYSKEQALQIIDAAKHNVNIKNMLDPELDHLQMRQIKLGERCGIDTSIYASPDFSAEQMKMLRVELIVRKIFDTVKEFFQGAWEKFANLIQRDTEQEAAQNAPSAESTVFDVLYKKVYERVSEQIDEQEGGELVYEGVFDIKATAAETAKDIESYYENFDKTIDESELMTEEQMIQKYEMEM